GERFMARYDPERMELSARDRVALANYTEIAEGRGGPNGGVFLDISHLGKDAILKKLPRMYRQFLELQRALRDTMWETCGVVRDHPGLERGLERVAELRELAADVDVRPTSEGYADLAHALDLRASLAAAEATLLGAVARRESRGAHQRRDHPEIDPELRVNFQTRLDTDGRLTTVTEPVPPIPPELQPWADTSEDLSVAGRLLE
ncbi:MAG TPA: hypothetical protein VK942_15410, partial [Actinomycetes bacterium]|nr:hypothetical protein [Actinomycetes bacterium]